MGEIKAKLAAKQHAPRRKIVKKKCDHAHTLNRLETHLKSRDNEYKTVKSNLDQELRKKEKELNTVLTATKQARANSELLRR